MAGKYKPDLVLKPASEPILARLQKLYTLKNPAEIERFLEKRIFLVELLIKTEQAIRKYFGEAELVLERTDALEASSACQMELDICPPLDAKDVISRFSNFNNGWYAKAAFKIKGNYCISLVHPAVQETPNLWDLLRELAGTYDGPEDWSLEHDHYIHGTPKRYSKENG